MVKDYQEKIQQLRQDYSKVSKEDEIVPVSAEREEMLKKSFLHGTPKGTLTGLTVASSTRLLRKGKAVLTQAGIV